MLNLTYHETRDEDVYNTLSERMQDTYDICGGLPDCIDDDWIEDITAFEATAQTHLHMRKMRWQHLRRNLGANSYRRDRQMGRLHEGVVTQRH